MMQVQKQRIELYAISHAKKVLLCVSHQISRDEYSTLILFQFGHGLQPLVLS